MLLMHTPIFLLWLLINHLYTLICFGVVYCTQHVILFTESRRKILWTRSYIPSLRGFDKSECSQDRDVIKHQWRWNDGFKWRARSFQISKTVNFNNMFSYVNSGAIRKRRVIFNFCFIAEKLNVFLIQYGKLGKVIPFISTILSNRLVSETTL